MVACCAAKGIDMRLIRETLWGLLLLGVCQLALAAGNWEPVRKGQGKEDVSTWVRTVDGMAVKAFRGVVEVPHTTPAILALLSDIDNLPSWIYQCKATELVPDRPKEQTHVFFRGIWPASDRDVLMLTTVSQQADQSVLVESREVGDFPVNSSYVRMPLLRNTFRLVPLPAGWTRVEFDTQVDLGGLVPTWLANMVSTSAPLTTLEGMRKQLQAKPQYNIKSVMDLPMQYLRGKVLVMPEGHMPP
jgi:START domain